MEIAGEQQNSIDHASLECIGEIITRVERDAKREYNGMLNTCIIAKGRATGEATSNRGKHMPAIREILSTSSNHCRRK